MRFSIENLVMTGIIMALFAAVLVIIISNIQAENPALSLTDDYSKNLTSYEKLEKYQNMSYTLSSSTDNITQDSSWVDVVGNYIGQGVRILKLTKESTETSQAMADEGLKSANLGPTHTLFRVAFGIVLLLGFAFAVIKIYLRVTKL